MGLGTCTRMRTGHGLDPASTIGPPSLVISLSLSSYLMEGYRTPPALENYVAGVENDLCVLSVPLAFSASWNLISISFQFIGILRRLSQPLNVLGHFGSTSSKLV